MFVLPPVYIYYIIIIYCSATSSVALVLVQGTTRVVRVHSLNSTCSASKYLIENDCEAFLLAALSLFLVLLCPRL